MKIKFSSKIILKFTVSVFFFILAPAFFISCENFLKGAETAKELEKNISYANAPTSSVILKSDESQGTFIAGDSIEFKVGYETEFYFSANIEVCILSGLTAQFATDSSKDVSEYISIKILERDDVKGLYKISVKVLKEAPTIIIKPVCLAYPAVESYSPKSDSEPGYANMPIVITFTVQMEDKNVIPEKSIFNYQNILLSYNGQKVSEYFEAPYFNEEKTVLTIKPKTTFLDYVASTNEVFIEINVDFASDIVVKTDSLPLPFKQNDKAHFTVRYKAEVEKEAPVKAGFGFFASIQKYELNSLNSMSLAEIADLDNFTQEEIAIKGDYSLEEYSRKVLQNRTAGEVYIYGRYYDKDSGVNSISVALQQTNEKTGLILRNQDKLEDLLTFDKTYTDSQIYKENNIVLFRYKYKLEGSDGAYSFNVKVYDACGNPSAEEAFTAIKDTELKLDDVNVFNVYNDLDNTSEPDTRFSKLMDFMKEPGFNYEEKIKTIQFLYGKHLYGPVEVSGLVKFFVKYVNKDQEEKIEELSRDPANERLYLHKLDVDHVHDLKITLIAEDEIGNSASRDYYFPPKPKRYADSNTILYTPGIRATAGFHILYNDDGSIKRGTTHYVKPNDYGFIFTSPVLPEKPRRKACFFYENGMLWAEANDDEIREIVVTDIYTGNAIPFDTDDTNTLPNNLDLSSTSFEFGTSADGSKYTFKTTLPPDTWDIIGDKYDYLYVYYDLFNIILDIYEKGITSKTTELEVFPTGSRKFFIAGLKDGKINPDPVQINYEFTEEADNALRQEMLERMPPEFSSFLPAGWFLLNTHNSYEPQEVDTICLGGDKVNEYLHIKNSIGKIESIQVTLDNAWRYNFSSDYIGKGRDHLLMSDDDGNIYVPAIDLHYGDNNITVTLVNKSGSTSYGEIFSINKAPIVFSKPQSLPVTGLYSLQSDPTPYDIRTSGYEGGFDYGGSVFVSYLDKDGWKRIISSELQLSDGKDWQMSGEEGAYVYSLKDEKAITLPVDKYIKVSSSLSFARQIGSLLFYNGEPSQGQLTDKIIDMDGFYCVSSNKPVYIYTIATMKSLSECSSWTADEWDTLRFKTNEQLLDFSANDDGNLRIYTPDTSWMQKGFCYVTIARFADGHAVVSKVREK
jgi:hypothetical protein